MYENISAPIFNVQFFSLHDGNGIRTCVFMKGCPLSCRWCANPESQSPNIQELRDAEKCAGCGACASGAPLSERAKNCPGGAVSISGELMTARQIADICLRDKPFYDESGGGVTLTGGEPLLRADFAIALIDALHESGVRAAIETTGFSSPEVFEKVISRADQALFDVKHFDSAKHREFTGVGNERILENLKRARDMDIDLLPRVPVIPGFNYTLTEAAGIARAIRGAGFYRAQLLPFHQFGERKYALTGKKYMFEGVPALHEEDLTEYTRAFSDNGVEAFI